MILEGLLSMVTELKEKQEAQVTPASREETLERLNAIEQALSELHSNPAVPEKDLQAIQDMIQESASQTLKDAMQGASVLMESYFGPKFKLLFENQQTMMETLAPKSRVDELEEEVAFLRSIIRQHSREIEELKHA